MITDQQIDAILERLSEFAVLDGGGPLPIHLEHHREICRQIVRQGLAGDVPALEALRDRYGY